MAITGLPGVSGCTVGPAKTTFVSDGIAVVGFGMIAARKSDWLLRAMLLLALFVLILGPTRAVSAMPVVACCAGSPCHEDGKATCLETCILACQAIVAPDEAILEPTISIALANTAMPRGVLAGLVVAPELPPPR